MVGFMPKDHLKNWHTEGGSGRGTRGSAQRYNVTCVSMGATLRRAGVKHINSFSLDVEGAELMVLKTMDFANIKVDVLVLEMSRPANKPEIDALLKKHGIVQYNGDPTGAGGFNGNNVWYVREGFLSTTSRVPKQRRRHPARVIVPVRRRRRPRLLPQRRRRGPSTRAAPQPHLLPSSLSPGLSS